MAEVVDIAPTLGSELKVRPTIVRRMRLLSQC
jgi:hypothetical protein